MHRHWPSVLIRSSPIHVGGYCASHALSRTACCQLISLVRVAFFPWVAPTEADTAFVPVSESDEKKPEPTVRTTCFRPRLSVFLLCFTMWLRANLCLAGDAQSGVSAPSATASTWRGVSDHFMSELGMRPRWSRPSSSGEAGHGFALSACM